MVTLFRPEVLESRRTSWVGEIRLTRPPSLALLAAAAALAALALGAFVGWAEYTRKVRVAGVLVPERGVIRLVAPQDAVLLERRVAEGAAVRAGEVLFVLSIDRAAASGDTQAAVQRSLAAREQSLRDAAAQQQALARQRLAALAQREAELGRERAALDAEAALVGQRIALAERALARLDSLQRDEFVSTAQVQAKSEELLGLKAQRVALERQQAAAARERSALDAQRKELPLQTATRLGELDRERAELAQQGAQSEAQQRLVVRATHDGRIGALLAQPGQAVTPAQALATLLPDGAGLQAHLYAPSSAVGFLRAGQPVLLRYDAFPYQKFGAQAGRIEQVSLAPLAAADLAGAGLGERAAREPLYRIAVALDRQDMPVGDGVRALVPGMQLEADVPVERRRIVEWLFAPVLGLARRV